MKFNQAINQLGANQATQIARQYCVLLGKPWNTSLQTIFSTLLSNTELSPENIGGKKDDATAVVEKWVRKYFMGYENRASQRISAMPGTVPDSIVDTIIKSRLSHLSVQQLEAIKYAHRLSMSAENILGLLLEEYLAERLSRFGWHCAWGETVRSVDFVNEDGRLLQIKNRSNSENSSSSRVRDGTPISKWYRVRHGNGEYMWHEMNKICATSQFSEKDFEDFVINALRLNPNCLPVERENPWQD